MKQIDRICGEIIKEYHTITGTNKFVNVFTCNGGEISNEVINDLIQIFKDKKLKKVAPISYEQLSFKGLIPYNIDPYINKEGKHKFVIREKTGLFKLTFNNGDILLIGRWMEGFGKSWTIRSVVIGETSTYYSYLKAFDHEVKKRSKPKNGIFRATFNQATGTVDYIPLTNLPNSPVIHPRVEEIQGDVNYYFNNVKLFTRYKQSGVRKFMIISEPGTGKTSLFYKLAQENRDKRCVIFCTDIQTAAHNIKLCAKHKVSTLIFLEDADSALQGNAHSSVLNFLDGVDTPYNPNGSLILMSTNFPENIEPRILTRPGRIDKRYEFELLSGKYAFECAKLYFGELFAVDKYKKQITEVASGMTGAQIKELALSSMSYAASTNREIDITLIEEVKRDLAKNLKEAYKYAEQNSVKKMLGEDSSGFGFR